MAGVLAFFALAGAQAASFDCAKVQSKMENLICENPELSQLDDQLAAVYRDAKEVNAQTETIKQAQRQWINDRNSCVDVKCVRRAYMQQMILLTQIGTKFDKNSGRNKYTLDYGKGHLLCELIWARMNNKLAHRGPGDPICAHDILKSVPSVAMPNWKKLDLKRNNLLYKRFLLANLVREKHYHQVFGKLAAGKNEIRLPTRDQMVGGEAVTNLNFGDELTLDHLEEMWEAAVEREDEFYRWDGAFAAPNDKDVLLIAVSRFDEVRQQTSCPRITQSRFSADLAMPKPWLQDWESKSAVWPLRPNAVSFVFDDELYLLDERLSEASHLSNGFELHTKKKPYLCRVSGNFYFPANSNQD